MGEHHQLGVMTETNACEEKTELEDLVVGACKYCVQHGRSLEEASNCPGRGGWSMCTGGDGGASLKCVMCNSKTKCRCPMQNATMVG